MSNEAISRADSNPADTRASHDGNRSWILRRLCSQNPFYLISVCLVLHGTANWFHAKTGVAFSPWPLLWLTTGYTLVLAFTGFVIIRFGQVWDDARSILLLILLLFVQLSLLFDETLVLDPATGRVLLGLCWAFSVGLSELLLRGLRIQLPWLFRLPYHGLLTLLFFYPLCLVSAVVRIPVDAIVWRIYLFPVVAAVMLLTLIPAIRRGQSYTRANGTPWLWPWYPWSLFVFLGVCICFRAYALCQSFDPVLGESLASAMKFPSVFGVYFLAPLVLAVGVLLLEIGIVERRPGAMKFAMFVPVFSLAMSIPPEGVGGPYAAFLTKLVEQAGSPIWTTLLAAALFYAVASLRNVPFAERWLAATLFLLTRADGHTTGGATETAFQLWPLLVLSAVEFWLGLTRDSSSRTFVAASSAILAFHLAVEKWMPQSAQATFAMTGMLLVLSVLGIGCLFRDRFAWLLRLLGAPLLVVATIAGVVYLERSAVVFPLQSVAAFAAFMALLALGYAILVAMPLYRLASLICAASGAIALLDVGIAYVVGQSGWHGAPSFASGIGCLLIAAVISFRKAGWLEGIGPWLRSMLEVPVPT